MKTARSVKSFPTKKENKKLKGEQEEGNRLEQLKKEEEEHLILFKEQIEKNG